MKSKPQILIEILSKLTDAKTIALYKKVLQRERINQVAEAIHKDMPTFISQSDEFRYEWILRYSIKQAIDEVPMDEKRVSQFVNAWWTFRQKQAVETTDRRFPDCTPEEREATIKAYCKEGFHND